MIRALGALLVVLAAGGTGAALAEGMKKRAALLRETEGFLRLAADELRQRETPLPALFFLAAEGGGRLAETLRSCGQKTARGLTAERALSPLTELLRESCGPQAAFALEEAARVLGRYDGETQAEACLRAALRLREEKEEAEHLAREKGRLCRAVSLCLGAMAALAVW